MDKNKSEYRGWIYLYKNKINNKMYVGQTSNLALRKQQHKSASHNKYPIDKAINKYGIENFEFQVLVEICRMSYQEYKKDIDELETFYMNKFRNEGFVLYNMTKKGGGNTWANYNSKRVYTNVSESQKDKIKQALKKYYSKHSGRSMVGELNTHSRCVDVIDITTEDIIKTYKCGKYACQDLNMNYSTFKSKMRNGGIKIDNLLYVWS